MKYYFDVLKKYAQFSGRARRSEYWYFVLFNVLILFGLSLLEGMLLTVIPPDSTVHNILAAIFFLYFLGMFIPWLAVLCRRLHDIGKSGGFFFIWFIPLIGAIWLLVLLFTEGDHGSNEYGPDPKNPEEELFDFEMAKESKN